MGHGIRNLAVGHRVALDTIGEGTLVSYKSFYDYVSAAFNVMSDSTIREKIKAMERGGLIEVEREPRGRAGKLVLIKGL